MPIDIVIKVHDEAAAQKVKAFANTVEKESGRAAGKMEGFFRRASQSVIQSTGTMGGSVTSVFASIGGKAGVTALAVTAIATAMTHLTKRAAEAGQTIEAIKFEATLDKLKRHTDSILDSIGNKLLPFYNRMFEFWGLAASTAEVTAKQTEINNERQKALRSLMTDILNLQNQIAESIEGIQQKRKIELKQLEDANEKMNVFSAKLFETEQTFENARDILRQMDAGQTIWPLTAAQIKEAKEEANEFLETLYTIDDAEADAARAEFLNEIEKGSKKASFEVDRLADSMAQLAQAIASTARSGGGFFDILPSLINIAFSYFSKGGFPLQFANGGIIGAQNGLIVKRPTLFMAGENFKPEAIVPLAADKGNQRNAVMQAAGLSDRGNITVVNNFNVPAIDPVTIRNLLLPEINRQIRRGEKLLASELR